MYLVWYSKVSQSFLIAFSHTHDLFDLRTPEWPSQLIHSVHHAALLRQKVLVCNFAIDSISIRISMKMQVNQAGAWCIV